MPRKSIASLPAREVKISALSHEGRGICQIDGKTTFIEGALPEETVLFNYTQQHSKFDEGRIQRIITASPQRVPAPCPHYNVCGGCALQHLSPQAQIQHKQQVLLEQLKHFAGLEPQEILPPILSQNLGYRTKARLGVRYVYKKNQLLVGFREKNQRFLADLQSCVILSPAVGQQIAVLKNFLNQLKIKEHIAQIEAAIGENGTALIIRHLQPIPSTDLQAIEQFADTYSFQIYLQPGSVNSIHKFYPKDQRDELIYTLPDLNLEFLFHPTDFTQINTAVNRQLVNLVIQLLQPDTNDKILDLFCGLGNFTLPLAKFSQHVIGVEGSEDLLRRARNNANHNNLTHAEFYTCNLMADFMQEKWANKHYDKLLLDPPRTGALAVVKNIGSFNPQKLVYVSCNPATLARDAGELAKQGYVLQKAGILDMFPHTSHVESIALFEKN